VASGQARKSPVVDGKVIRNARGKELRYPLILNNDEKEIARKVVLAFGQTLCGFDLLRSEGRSYVCDVNGWSFVKDSHKFWADSANLLRQYCLHAICAGGRCLDERRGQPLASLLSEDLSPDQCRVLARHATPRHPCSAHRVETRSCRQKGVSSQPLL